MPQIEAKSERSPSVRLPKHLILFIDINGTIILSDTANGKTQDSGIYQAIAEHFVDNWLENEPSAPEAWKKPMTGRELIELMHKTQKPTEAQYADFYFFVMQLKRPIFQQLQTKRDEFRNKVNEKEKIFPSLIRMINELKANEVPFTIIFRTFGKDGSAVEKELRDRGIINIQSRAKFSDSSSCVLTQEQAPAPLTTMEQMLDSIRPGEHQVWQDSYEFWKSTQLQHVGGKPYFVSNDPNKLILFWDDNATDKEILCARIAGLGPIKNQAELQNKLIELGWIIPLTTWDALEHDDFFVNCVTRILQAYAADENYITKSVDSLKQLPSLQPVKVAAFLDLFQKASEHERAKMGFPKHAPRTHEETFQLGY